MGLTASNDPDLVMQRRQQLADQLGFDLTGSLMTVQQPWPPMSPARRS